MKKLIVSLSIVAVAIATIGGGTIGPTVSPAWLTANLANSIANNNGSGTNTALFEPIVTLKSGDTAIGPYIDFEYPTGDFERARIAFDGANGFVVSSVLPNTFTPVSLHITGNFNSDGNVIAAGDCRASSTLVAPTVNTTQIIMNTTTITDGSISVFNLLSINTNITIGGNAYLPSISSSIKTVAANYTVSVLDTIVQVDASGGNKIITLLAPAATNNFVTIMKKDSSGNSVIVTNAGGLINGKLANTNTTQYNSFTFYSDGTNSFVK